MQYKINVNEWQWKSKEADEIFHEGAKEVSKAIMLRKMKGLKDPGVQSEIKGALEKAISLIEKALSIERPPHPLAYYYLTKAYAELGGYYFYIDENITNFTNITPNINSLFNKARVNAEKANESYEQSTGWDAGGRFDFHASMARVYLLSNEFERAQEEIDKAKQFNGGNAMFKDDAAAVEKSLEEIKKAGIQKGEIHDTRIADGLLVDVWKAFDKIGDYGGFRSPKDLTETTGYTHWDLRELMNGVNPFCWTG